MPDEIKSKQDSSQSSGDSSGKAGESTSQPVTFTKEQRDKAVSDALAKVGRTAKDFEKRESAIKEAQSLMEKWQRERDEEEEESVRGDSDKLSELRKKRTLAQKEREISDREKAQEAREAEYAERLRKADEAELNENIKKSAQAHGLEASVLGERCARFELTSAEDIEEMASSMTPKDQKPPLHIDSSESKGAGEKTTEQKLKERYPKMLGNK